MGDTTSIVTWVLNNGTRVTGPKQLLASIGAKPLTPSRKKTR